MYASIYSSVWYMDSQFNLTVHLIHHCTLLFILLAAKIVSTFDDAHTITDSFQFIAWYRVRVSYTELVYRRFLRPDVFFVSISCHYLLHEIDSSVSARQNRVRIDVVQLYNLIDTNTFEREPAIRFKVQKHTLTAHRIAQTRYTHKHSVVLLLAVVMSNDDAIYLQLAASMETKTHIHAQRTFILNVSF